MVSDYGISWSYIVDRMKSRFGIKPDSKEKYSMGEIDRNIDLIWDEYFDKLWELEESERVKVTQ